MIAFLFALFYQRFLGLFFDTRKAAAARDTQSRFARLPAEQVAALRSRMDPYPPPRRLKKPLGGKDLEGWQLKDYENGRQVWHKQGSPTSKNKGRDNRSGGRSQSEAEKHFLGLLPKKVRSSPASSAAAAAVHGAAFLRRVQIPASGHLGNDYGGPMFLLPGILIALYAGGKREGELLPEPQQAEMRRYLRNQQNADGGWGISTVAPSGLFGSCLSYIALRLLGVAADDDALVDARAFIHANGGPTAAPQWAKFWMSVLNVFSWEGVTPFTPELWIMPRWVPFHPWRFWCHCRMVYLPMAYCYGARFAVPETQFIRDLRDELYPSSTPYGATRFRDTWFDTSELDRYEPTSAVLRASFFVLGLYEYVAPTFLRNRAQSWLLQLMAVEDMSTHYIDIGPVNKAMNMVCALAAYGPRSQQYQSHEERVGDYLWLAADGMKMQGYNGSQLWDTAFAVQATVSVLRATKGRDDLDLEPARAFVRDAYDFVDRMQVRDNVPNGEYYYRHKSKGAWPFSTAEHGWPISDCSSEGLKAVFAAESVAASVGLSGRLSRDRIDDCIDIMLSLRNAHDDGGFPTYELKRAGEWLEALNPSETFFRIMVDYSYIELTSTCCQAMSEYLRLHPEAERRPEIERALQEGLDFVKARQRPDGSYYGSWAICFTYAAWFAVDALVLAGEGKGDEVARAVDFLLSKQSESDGGWGETYWSCFLGEYTSDGNSYPENTGWALLALTKAYPHLDGDRAKRVRTAAQRAAKLLMATQLEDGSWESAPQGIGIFNGSTMIWYGNYALIFPTWALAEYSAVFEH